jgi:hypothetical protein
MPDIDTIRAEIEHKRKLVDRQRRNIRLIRVAGRPAADAELMLALQLARLDGLIGERNRLKAAEVPSATRRRVLGGRSW